MNESEQNVVDAGVAAVVAVAAVVVVVGRAKEAAAERNTSDESRLPTTPRHKVRRHVRHFGKCRPQRSGLHTRQARLARLLLPPVVGIFCCVSART